ncbi:MAG TPA: C1 family peptidase [Bacteroidia bacterium]|nr:C1 family peptidase [Bacteroidia bacterium]
MASIASTKGKGWMRDYPDFRDNTTNTKTVSDRQAKRGAVKPVQLVLDDLHKVRTKKLAKAKSKAAAKSPVKVDLREWCSPIEDQGEIGSCTAHAGTALYEYFERRAYGKHIEASRLFLYKVTRNLLNWTGDDGAYLRTTMGALAMFGLVPEKYWPYVEDKFNDEPAAFHYSFAKNYKALLYYRLDVPGLHHDKLLEKIKEHLSMGLPLIFGFTCFTSLDQDSVEQTGGIPFPDEKEETDGGHAVMAVGFDDSVEVVNASNRRKTKGAIMIRNSWSKKWGMQGYGWLPYEYVLQGLATDWWTMTKGEWIETGKFGLDKP